MEMRTLAEVPKREYQVEGNINGWLIADLGRHCFLEDLEENVFLPGYVYRRCAVFVDNERRASAKSVYCMISILKRASR